MYTPGLHDPEKEVARMSTFLLIFGLAALLIVGGMRGSLHLRTHRISTGRRLSGLRRFHAAQSNYTTEDEMSHRARKIVITLIILLVMLSVIILSALNAVNH
jgi:hypothetical protein